MKLEKLKTLRDVQIYMCGLIDGLEVPKRAAQHGKVLEHEKLNAIEVYTEVLSQEYGADHPVAPNWLEAFTAVAGLMVQTTHLGVPPEDVVAETAKATKAWRARGEKQPGLVQ